MAWKRKIPNDRDELAAHIRAGIDEAGIAEIYGARREAVHRELVRHGLIFARTRAVLFEEAMSRKPTAEPKKGEVILHPHKTTLMGDFYVHGKGFEVRPMSLPANSMHRVMIASKRKPTGGQHAGL